MTAFTQESRMLTLIMYPLKHLLVNYHQRDATQYTLKDAELNMDKASDWVVLTQWLG